MLIPGGSSVMTRNGTFRTFPSYGPIGVGSVTSRSKQIQLVRTGWIHLLLEKNNQNRLIRFSCLIVRKMVNLDGKTCIHTTETIYSYAKDVLLNKITKTEQLRQRNRHAQYTHIRYILSCKNQKKIN